MKSGSNLILNQTRQTRLMNPFLVAVVAAVVDAVADGGGQRALLVLALELALAARPGRARGGLVGSVLAVDLPVAPASYNVMSIQIINKDQKTTVWGGRLRKRFCSMFSGSFPCLLGQHGSCSSAQLPVELSEESKQNLRNKWPPHPVVPV